MRAFLFVESWLPKPERFRGRADKVPYPLRRGNHHDESSVNEAVQA
ncbi:MAG: hypothetical protein M9932_18995 [Xanthobacteraceae bacterium]|nr:hypothetical protein [Xanthobacteraceae bacterium]